MPEISVIMSVFNGEKYLREAMDSIVNQTFKDFEFLIFDDGSTDSTPQILTEYQSDSRVKTIRKDENKGFAGFVENLNLGLKTAAGKYIARMDADDICRNDRFQKQHDFLENNPEYFLVGSSAEKINEKGERMGDFKALESSDLLQKKMMKWNGIYHPTIMFRNSGELYYREKFVGCEDYDFYLRLISEGKKLVNLSEPLLKYRILDFSLSRKSNRFRRNFLVEKAKKFYTERKQNRKDSYSEMNLEKIQNVLNLSCKSGRSDLSFAAKVALKYSDKKSLEIILEKVKTNKEHFGGEHFYRIISAFPQPFFSVLSGIYNRLL